MTPRDSVCHDILPLPTLSRLPWYLAYIDRLHSNGVEFVSSTAISRQINVDASQIAKDLSYLGIKGKTRIGYEVKALASRLGEFLGFRESHNAIMAGVGSLGSALIADGGLQRFGLRIVAGIDTDAAVAGSCRSGVNVYFPEQLADLVSDFHAEIGILAVPVQHAQAVADRMVEAGIRALWNFTPCRIVSREDVVVQDTSIYAHLAVIYHRLKMAEHRCDADKDNAVEGAAL